MMLAGAYGLWRRQAAREAHVAAADASGGDILTKKMEAARMPGQCAAVVPGSGCDMGRSGLGWAP